MICYYARLKNAEEAYKNLKGLLIEFSRENLFTMSPAGIASAESDIFSFDANEAAPAAMAEMLIQSHEGYIEFLPTLPDAWKTGYFKGICVRNGAKVDLKWENKVVKKAKIHATANNNFSIKLPSELNKLQISVNGQPFTPENSDNQIISVWLNKEDRLEIIVI